MTLFPRVTRALAVAALYAGACVSFAADEPPPPPEQAPANPAEPPPSPYGSIKWDYSPLGVYGPTYTSPDQQNRLTLGLFIWFDNSFVLDDDEMADALGRDEIDGESRIATTRL